MGLENQHIILIVSSDAWQVQKKRNSFVIVSPMACNDAKIRQNHPWKVKKHDDLLQYIFYRIFF
jgi:hypothetical protein